MSCFRSRKCTAMTPKTQNITQRGILSGSVFNHNHKIILTPKHAQNHEIKFPRMFTKKIDPPRPLITGFPTYIRHQVSHRKLTSLCG